MTAVSNVFEGSTLISLHLLRERTLSPHTPLLPPTHTPLSAPPPQSQPIYDERYSTFGRVPFGRMSEKILSYVGPHDDNVNVEDDKMAGGAGGGSALR